MPAEKNLVKPLKEVAQDAQNRSQLGDPVSLKAETSKGSPTNQDKGAQGGHKSLKQIAEEKMEKNPTQLGDPVSLKAETSDTEPTEQDRGAAGADPRKDNKNTKPKL
ncbi:hypothetical protein H2203_002964 [Taxawa tesnikishii (nom. ined.)]|nr:hypothetical protein H2203_002964 [Dothideales sp. JES 119]